SEIPSTSFPFLLAIPLPEPPKLFRKSRRVNGKNGHGNARALRLLGVQLDDKLLIERGILYVLAFRHCNDLRLELLAVHFEPRHAALALRHVTGIKHHSVLVHVVLDRNLVPDADEVGRYVDLLPVDADVAMQDELARLRVRRREAGAVE